MEIAELGKAEGSDWRLIQKRFTEEDLTELLSESQLDEIGQWRVNLVTYGGPWICTPRDGYLIASLRSGFGDNVASRKRAIANAHLLAAAPELARQCLALIRDLSRDQFGRTDKGGPTTTNPDRPYCKPDQSCCDFCCGN